MSKEPTHELAALSWPEVGDALLLLVPCGSCEQHGPHLPLHTDTLIAVAVAQAVAGRVDGSMVAPAVAIGASGEHDGFPGTLSVGTPAMRDVAVEIARSALPHRDSGTHDASGVVSAPFRAVVFVNGHGGNVEALTAAVDLLASEGRAVAAWHPRVPDGDPHAGRTETSLMLHLHPEWVRMELAEPGSPARFREISDVLGTDGLRAVTPNGILGDPTGATAEEGALLFDTLCDDAVATVQSLSRVQPVC